MDASFTRQLPRRSCAAVQTSPTAGRHPQALNVAHDQGLSPGTENTNGNDTMDEDEEINQVEHGRAWTTETHVEGPADDELRPRSLENCVKWKPFAVPAGAKNIEWNLAEP